jgi:hypothetical protein
MGGMKWPFVIRGHMPSVGCPSPFRERVVYPSSSGAIPPLDADGSRGWLLLQIDGEGTSSWSNTPVLQTRLRSNCSDLHVSRSWLESCCSETVGSLPPVGAREELPCARLATTHVSGVKNESKNPIGPFSEPDLHWLGRCCSPRSVQSVCSTKEADRSIGSDTH